MNYIVTYKVRNNRGETIKSGKYKVKNKQSEFEAKCSFENFIKRKTPDFYSLEISSCFVDLGFGIFNDLFK